MDIKKILVTNWSALFFLPALFFFFFLPPTDPDLGWQLRCGGLILRQHDLCSKNSFTVLEPNYVWPNHHWMYQSIIYPLYQVAGFWGLTVINALISIAAFAFWWFAIKDRAFLKVAGALAAIYLGWGVFSFGIRSQIVGFLFYNILLFIVSRFDAAPRLAIFLPFLFVLWANVHASVILGIIVLVYLTVRYLLSKYDGNCVDFIIANRLIIAASLTAVFAPLLNPYGINLFKEAWRHFAVVEMDKLIAEWVPPRSFVYYSVVLAGVVTAVVLLYSHLRSGILTPAERGEESPKIAKYLLAFTDAASITILTYWAVGARRNVPLYLVLIFYLLLSSEFFKNLNQQRDKLQKLSKYFIGAISSLLVLILLLVRIPKATAFNRSVQSYSAESGLALPYSAVQFLRSREEKGAIFNRYEWGGYLIWQLPEYKIFVDGRMPAWDTESGESPYTTYLHILQTREGWNSVLKQYGIDWILISPGTFMDLELRDSPAEYGWDEVYRDEKAVVYREL